MRSAPRRVIRLHLLATFLFVAGALAAATLAPRQADASDFTPFTVCDPQGGFANLDDIFAVGDGQNTGFYVAWTDVRDGNVQKIYTTRLTTTGAPWAGWPVNGAAMSAYYPANTLPIVVPEANGGAYNAGAYVVWSNTTTGLVFAQRVDGTGQVVWDPSGVVVQHPDCRPISGGEFTRAIRSSDGKLYVGFAYGQQSRAAVARLNISDGSLDPTWLPYQDVSGYQGWTNSIALAPDANGGVFVLRNAGTGLDLYSRHFNAAGVPYSEPSEVGRLVGVTQGKVFGIQAIPDGGSGVYVAWCDDRSLANAFDIYVIRLNADGTVYAGWPTTGLRVTTLTSSNQVTPSLAMASNGNLTLSWMDFRRGSSYRDIYATRVTPSGTFEAGWSANGVSVGLSVMNASRFAATRAPQMQPMPDGGTYFAWSRLVGTGGDVFGSRLSSTGVGDPAGKPIADGTKSELDAVMAMGNGSNVGVFWREIRSSSENLGAALRGAIFQLDMVPMSATAAPVATADIVQSPGLRTLAATAGRMRFSVTLAGDARGRLEIFDLAGRKLSDTDLQSLGAGTHEVSVTPAHPLARGLYFARLSEGRESWTRRIIITAE